VIRSTLVYAGSYIVMRSVSFLILPYVARVLGPAEFGELDLLVTATQVVGLLATIGVVEAVLRFAGAGRRAAQKEGLDPREAMANGLAITLISGLLFLIVTQAMAPWLARTLPGGLGEGSLRLALLAGVASAWTGLPTTIMRMQDQALRYSGFMLSQALLQAAGNVLAVWLGFGVFGINFVSAAVACAIAAAATVAMLRETGLRLDPAVARRLLVYGLPILGSAIAAFMMNGMERWVLAARVDAQTYGHYAAAAKLFVLAVIAFQPFMLWWGSQRFRLLAGPQGGRQLVHYASLGLLLLFLLCTTISMLNPLILEVLFGAAYEVPAWWASALLLVMLLRTVTDLTGIGVFLGESSHQQMLIQYAAAALTLVGLFALVPSLGVTGLVLALTAGAALRLTLFYVFSQRRRWLPYPKRAIAALLALYLAGSWWTASQPPGAPVPLIAATALVLALMVAAAYLTGRGVLVADPEP
jgi:O-antigen/teichoic acid export membrane protein